jgi:hypothetical protein
LSIQVAKTFPQRRRRRRLARTVSRPQHHGYFWPAKMLPNTGRFGPPAQQSNRANNMWGKEEMCFF